MQPEAWQRIALAPAVPDSPSVPKNVSCLGTIPVSEVSTLGLTAPGHRPMADAPRNPLAAGPYDAR